MSNPIIHISAHLTHPLTYPYAADDCQVLLWNIAPYTQSTATSPRHTATSFSSPCPDVKKRVITNPVMAYTGTSEIVNMPVWSLQITGMSMNTGHSTAPGEWIAIVMGKSIKALKGIPWHSNLVDLSQLPQDTLMSPLHGTTKTSFTAEAAHPVPFHKVWSSPGKATDSPTGRPIAFLYLSSPPSAFETRKSDHDSTCPRPSQRRIRNPTTLNVMVAGAKGVGKTSLLYLLLDTADIFPTTTAD
ncbi:hypothetical protein BD311DRAFT_811362 [Dichomitus squalens]|uniref:Uncharacterized protein n=1 Tax=Dichomitus squalens TaxID=114155 RepID=A0A4Q9MA89_9APHY|nr:hypothetical protein BD311DRAFT_811362 [Dichomitus squalens]